MKNYCLHCLHQFSSGRKVFKIIVYIVYCLQFDFFNYPEWSKSFQNYCLHCLLFTLKTMIFLKFFRGHLSILAINLRSPPVCNYLKIFRGCLLLLYQSLRGLFTEDRFLIWMRAHSYIIYKGPRARKRALKI